MTYMNNEILSGNPYFDDFDDAKKFLRILFKPGYAVQARELTQLQTLLQSQISKFGDHVFTDGSIVFGGSVSLNRTTFLRVTGNYQESLLRNVVGKMLTSLDNTVKAKCIEVLPSTSSDNNPVLFVQYLSAKQYTSGQVIYVENNATKLKDFWESTSNVTAVAYTTQELTSNATLASVDTGIFYVDGFFVSNTKQTVPLYKVTDGYRYFNLTDSSIGFTIERDVITPSMDNTLKDPASGSYNFNAPGADRYSINLVLSSFSTTPSDANYIELARVFDSKLTYSKTSPSYSEILELFARRTYDESGNYTVKPFGLELKEYLKRDKISFNATIFINGVQSAFTYPTSATTLDIISYTSKYPAQVGDVLIRSSDDDASLTEYVITKVSSRDTISLDFEVVPKNDAQITSTTYTNLPTNATVFLLKRMGETTQDLEASYRVNSSYGIKIISDVSGVVSIVDSTPAPGSSDSDLFAATVTPGKAYIYGYEFETTTPVNVFGTKPRKFFSVDSETIDSTLGNYLEVTAVDNKFSADGYDPTFDLNNFPDVNLQKLGLNFRLAPANTNFSEFVVKYWSPSTRKTLNPFVSSEAQSQWNAYNWSSSATTAVQESEHYYPHVVFLQQSDERTSKVLLKEIVNTDTENLIHGFIERRDIQYGDSLYWALLPNKTDTDVHEPQTIDAPVNILDSSYETETGISRLVFNQAWTGDFITAYDQGFDGYDSGKKYTRGYSTSSVSDVYQIDYINLGSVVTDSEGNVSENNLRQSIRVKKAKSRRWVPGSSNDSLSLSDNSLFIKIPTSNIVFGPTLNETRGFSLPNSTSDLIEHGVVFNPSLGYENSYGSSIQVVIAEPNVVKLTLQGPITSSTSCSQTLTSIENNTTKRNFGSFREGEEVLQVYYRNNNGYTATGIVKKVITNGDSYEVFVKITGNEAPVDFIPQSYEGITTTGGEYEYSGISALLQGTNIINDGPICACYTITAVSSFAEGNPTCGEFTEITFNEGYQFGKNFEVGEQVYQFDIDYVPLDNAQPPSNFDAQKVLALGTVMSWDTKTCTLSILVTKNEFKQKSGWIFGRNSRVRYGGRGWNLNQHAQITQTYGSEQIKEVEQATGIFVDLDAREDISFVDSFNTSSKSIVRAAYQVETYSNVEINLTGETTSQNSKALTGSSPWYTEQQYASITGDIFTAKGNIISYTPPSPVTGYGYLIMEPIAGMEEFFAFRNGIPNTLSVSNSAGEIDTTISVIAAESVVPNESFYQPISVNSFIQTFTGSSNAVNYVTVATAKAKQLKQVDGTLYNVYLTEIKPFVLPNSNTYYTLDNIERITRTRVDGNGNDIEQEMFKIGQYNADGTAILPSSKNIQQSNNSSLLYKFPIGDKVKSVTSLTYEIQVDLKSNYSVTNGLLFNTEMTGNVKFKGENYTGSFYYVDISILREYVLIAPDSTIINLTDSTVQTRIINAGKTLQITDSSDRLVTGTYTLICPMLVEGSTSSNIRYKQKKRIFETVKFDDSTGLISLSKSDVVSLESCINLSTTSPTIIPLDILQLNGNQKNNVYELSTINATQKWRDANIKNGSEVTTSPNGIKCLVSYTYYEHTGIGPILAGSYVDGYDSIPHFLDPLTNKKISLDSVVDFRPFQYVDATKKIVTSGVYGIPSSGSAIYTNYSYYIPNKYSLVLSRDKQFYIISGTSAINPESPELPPNSMTLFNFDMEPYTVNANTVKTMSVNHQRYTMDDIRKIEDRVDNLEYTTRLSLLEQEAKAIRIMNGTTGVEKPKTSILVDSFVTHEVGDTLNPDYNISIDSEQNLLRPPFDAKFIQLNNTGSSSVLFSSNSILNAATSYPENLAYLNYTLIPIIDQRVTNNSFVVNPFSSSVWVGNISINNSTNPEYDNSIAPYIISNSNGNNDTFENMKYSPLNYNLGAFGTKWNFWQTNWQGYRQNSQNVKSSYGRLVDYIKSQVPKIPKKLFGSKALNADLTTYMPSFSTGIRISGLKPNTLVYPFFDGVRVDSYMSKTTLQSDSSGSIDVIFNIPSRTFKSGEKYFVVSDDPNGDKSLSTTYAEYKILNSAISNESSDYLSMFGSKTTETKSNDMIDYRSVVAQKFFVDERQYPRGVFVKRLDIFFKTKETSSNYPITLDIRPVREGYPIVGPGSFSYPNASITKLPYQINTSDVVGPSSSGTVFEFDAPVHLLPGEHAIVLSTNSNNYSVHSSDYGSNSTESGGRISPAPYVGKLMTTNNSKTWTVYENTDIAFVLNRCSFVSNGYITFNDPYSSRLPHLYSYANINLSYSDLNSNQIDCTIATINQNDGDPSRFESEVLSVNINSNIQFDKLKYFKYNNNSFNLTINLRSDGVISPILDLNSLRLIAIKNLIKTPRGGYADIDIDRTDNELRPSSLVHEEYANARYITKIVELDPEMMTKECHVFLKLTKPKSTNIKVYIKRQYVNTDININEIEYEEMISTGIVPESTRAGEYIDLHYVIPADRISNIISRYNIKIAMFSNLMDYSNDVPMVKDLKIITTPGDV